MQLTDTIWCRASAWCQLARPITGMGARAHALLERRRASAGPRARAQPIQINC